MNQFCHRLWRTVMMWGLALALLCAPFSGMGPGHAMAASSATSMPAMHPSALPMMAEAAAHHDCERMGAVPPDPAGPAAFSSYQDELPASQQEQMPCCDDVCLMACHVILMLPPAFALPLPVVQMHEVRVTHGLKTQGMDVLLPPPRTGV